MKFFGLMIGFLALIAAAFMLGYKTELTSDAGANPSEYGVAVESEETVGGIRFGSGGSSGASSGRAAPPMKRCAVQGARC